MLLSERCATLASISAAERGKLAEQVKSRRIINAALATSATDMHMQRFEALGCEGLHAHMAGRKFPPTQQEWKAFTGIEWSDVPKRKKLNQISDAEIRFAALHYTEVSEHSDRLEAMARYFGSIGPSN